MAGSTTLERMLIVGRVDTPTVLGIWAKVQSLATGTLEAAGEKLLHAVL
jgi:hypothetical protein